MSGLGLGQPARLRTPCKKDEQGNKREPAHPLALVTTIAATTRCGSKHHKGDEAQHVYYQLWNSGQVCVCDAWCTAGLEPAWTHSPGMLLCSQSHPLRGAIAAQANATGETALH